MICEVRDGRVHFEGTVAEQEQFVSRVNTFFDENPDVRLTPEEFVAKFAQSVEGIDG